LISNDVDELSPGEIVKRIGKLNFGIQKFWSQAHGWAPTEAAGLLAKSRLDWQVSLSRTLILWVEQSDKSLTPGELILAWANLGSLIEGTLKTFLSVWYDDYMDDIDDLKKANAYHHKKAEPLQPDGLTLGPLALYFENKKLLSAESTALIELAHNRRNAIHAFQDKELGTTEEFQAAVRTYLKLLREVNGRLPYPENTYIPLEA
jgi:hypothetical protein